MFYEKEKYLVFIFVWFLLLGVGVIIAEITGEVITGDFITGEATQTVGMNITVTSGAPSLNILSPTNTTLTVSYRINTTRDVNAPAATVRSEESFRNNP